MDWEKADGMTSKTLIPDWGEVEEKEEGRRRKKTLLVSIWATPKHVQAVLSDIKWCVTTPQIELGSCVHAWYNVLKVIVTYYGNTTIWLS